MWWNKKKKEPDLKNLRDDLNAMAAALLHAVGLNFDESGQLEQALVGTFLFGMIQTHGMMNELQPPQVHALALLVFKDSLHYTDEAAARAIQECINATSPAYHDTMNAILHRGVDGHRQYLSNDLAGLSENISSILAQFQR